MNCYNLKMMILGAATAFAAAAATPQKAQAQDRYIGEIITVAFTFCPRGTYWATGGLASISEDMALFSLLGISFGGDGQVSFAVPDTRSRSLMGRGMGPGLPLAIHGAQIGLPTRVLAASNLPSHSHKVRATNKAGDLADPSGNLLGAAPPPPDGIGEETIYAFPPYTTYMSHLMIAPAGSNTAFSVRDPILALNHCVFSDGVFPRRP